MDMADRIGLAVVGNYRDRYDHAKRADVEKDTLISVS